MCNLYELTNGPAEIARMFSADSMPGNVPAQIYPGYPGWVLHGGGLRSMAWGFPLAMTGKQGQALKPRPVNNARTDKLSGGFWRDSFKARRCLVPASRYAEAEGERCHMTRTWFSLPDQPIFSIAGIWRDSPEWGAAYAMVTSDPNELVAPVHDRMPIIIAPADRACWLHGSDAEAFSLCRPYAGTMQLDRTNDLWRARPYTTSQ